MWVALGLRELVKKGLWLPGGNCQKLNLWSRGGWRRGSMWADKVTEDFLEEGALALGMDHGGQEEGQGYT